MIWSWFSGSVGKIGANIALESWLFRFRLCSRQGQLTLFYYLLFRYEGVLLAVRGCTCALRGCSRTLKKPLVLHPRLRYLPFGGCSSNPDTCWYQRQRLDCSTVPKMQLFISLPKQWQKKAASAGNENCGNGKCNQDWGNEYAVQLLSIEFPFMKLNDVIFNDTQIFLPLVI